MIHISIGNASAHKLLTALYIMLLNWKLKINESLHALHVELIRPGAKIMWCEIESVGNASMQQLTYYQLLMFNVLWICMHIYTHMWE